MDVGADSTDTLQQIEILYPVAPLGGFFDTPVSITKPDGCIGNDFTLHGEQEMPGFLQGRMLRANGDCKSLSLLSCKHQTTFAFI